jgi:hypothetical protein
MLPPSVRAGVVPTHHASDPTLGHEQPINVGCLQIARVVLVGDVEQHHQAIADPL